jgi:hypothetical protein
VGVVWCVCVCACMCHVRVCALPEGFDARERVESITGWHHTVIGVLPLSRYLLRTLFVLCYVILCSGVL